MLKRVNLRQFSSMPALVRSEVREIQGINVGIISLSDPSRLNALTETMGDQFAANVANMSVLARKQDIRACIITGDGDAFSAGGDLAWLKERHTTAPYLNSLVMVDFYNRYLCVRNIGVPTIAAINGAAIGAGMCMTLACDIRVAASSAKLGFTFAKLGIHPGMGASVLLPRLLRPEMAQHMLMSAEIVTGTQAAARGLVLEAVAKEDVFKRAMELALEYGRNSPIAVQSCMTTLRNQKFLGLEAALVREADAQSQAYASTDLLEGLQAVKNKSSANFKGWAINEARPLHIAASSVGRRVLAQPTGMFGGTTSETSSTSSILPTFTEESACSKICPKLTYKQRLIGFVGCAASGYVLSLIGTLTLVGGMTNANVRTFIILYVIGNIIALAATGFLIGPKSQCNKMWAVTRRYSTAFFLIMLIIVFAVAVAKQNIILVLFLLFVEILAATWYSLSYVPYGRRIVLGMARRSGACMPCFFVSDAVHDAMGGKSSSSSESGSSSSSGMFGSSSSSK